MIIQNYLIIMNDLRSLVTDTTTMPDVVALKGGYYDRRDSRQMAMLAYWATSY